MKKRICVVITARPSYSRIKSALEAIANRPGLDLKIIVTGSALLARYGSVVQQIKRDGFRITRQLHTVIEGDEPVVMAKSTGTSLIELGTTFADLSPDLVVTIADRYETIATALAATYMNLPLAHVQGGEITGSIDNRVRNAVSKLADLHIVSSESAAEQLKQMGEPASSIFVTGCPSIDVALSASSGGPVSGDTIEHAIRPRHDFRMPDNYLVVLQHPDTTNYNETFAEAAATLKAVRELRMPTFWFTPNIDAGYGGISAELERVLHFDHSFPLWAVSNLAPVTFLQLIHHCACIIGNSSVGIRECAFLGVPVVNIGNRQSGRTRGSNVLDVTSVSAAIVRAVKKQLMHGHYVQDLLYGDGRSGERIADVFCDFLRVGSDTRNANLATLTEFPREAA